MVELVKGGDGGDLVGGNLLPLGRWKPAWPCMVAARAAAWISSQVNFFTQVKFLQSVNIFLFFDDILHLLIIVLVTQ